MVPGKQQFHVQGGRLLFRRVGVRLGEDVLDSIRQHIESEERNTEEPLRNSQQLLA